MDVVETWRGNYPITGFVRDALRRKQAQVKPDALLEPAQALLTACEFSYVPVAELARDPEPATVEKLIAGAEEALSHTEDRVDELIARFTAEQLNLRAAQDDACCG